MTTRLATTLAPSRWYVALCNALPAGNGFLPPFPQREAVSFRQRPKSWATGGGEH
jgi:hypothetical protein